MNSLPLVTTPWHMVYAALIFLAGFWLSDYISSKFGISSRRSALLYCWHTLWCLIYLWYSLSAPADSRGYYIESLTFSGLALPGTAFVTWFTSIFTQYGGASYLGAFLTYNVIGVVGLIAFYASLKSATIHRGLAARRFALLIVLLPSVSFWSSAIGKDSIAFMAASLAVWAALDLRARKGLMAFAILSMMLVRPHISGIMLIALLMSYIANTRNLLNVKSLVGFILFAGVSVYLLPYAVRYSGLTSLDLIAITQYIETRQGYNLSDTAGVDLSSMSLPMQIFTYVFRPLPFEARSIFQLASSIDNVVFMILAAMAAHSLLKGRSVSSLADRKFLLFYVIGSCLILAVTTANLGIAVRQKWMFMPMLIFLMLSLVGRDQSLRRKTRSNLHELQGKYP